MFKRVKFTHNHTSYPFEWDFFVSCQYNIDRKVVSVCYQKLRKKGVHIVAILKALSSLVSRKYHDLG